MGKSDHSDSQGKILVIDDEEAAVRVLTHLLERAGYEVTSTQTARDAFFLLRENPADLIITDIFMPDINGLEVIKRLKKLYPDTPVFAISGGSTMAGRDCLELAL